MASAPEIQTVRDLTPAQRRALRGIADMRTSGGVDMATLRANGNRRDVVDRLCALGLVYVSGGHGEPDNVRFDLTDRGSRLPDPELEESSAKPLTMTTAQVQQALGLGTPDAARVQLSRWGIEAVGRDVVTGEKLWSATEVHAADANRPGRGARGDRFQWPHLAVAQAVIRYDVGDENARRAGTPMVKAACGEEIVATLTTRRTDKVRCPRCQARLAAPTGSDRPNACEDAHHVPRTRMG